MVGALMNMTGVMTGMTRTSTTEEEGTIDLRTVAPESAVTDPRTEGMTTGGESSGLLGTETSLTRSRGSATTELLI